MVTSSVTTLRSSSPLKASRDVDETMMSMQQDNTMLQMQMGEKDVEMERMEDTPDSNSSVPEPTTAFPEPGSGSAPSSSLRVVDLVLRVAFSAVGRR